MRHSKSTSYKHTEPVERKGKERKSIYIAPSRTKVHTMRSGMDHTVLPANNTMPAFPSWAITRCHHHNRGSRHPIATYYTHLSTPKGWKSELAWLVDLQRMVYPHKLSPISYSSSAGQRRHAGQRLTFYRWTTQPTRVVSRDGGGRNVNAAMMWRQWLVGSTHLIVSLVLWHCWLGGR